jgi:hypothetical protein
MVPRLGRLRLRSLLRHFPAAAVMGPRQCGKTTLVRTLFPKAEFFDLERPSDLQRLEADPEYILRHARPPVILDEAQRLPALFPLLRALIDERRAERGRFLLLGSAHPSLARGISESLAGRIGFLDLDPFAYAEVAGAGVTLADLWVRGGFPDACLNPHRRARRDWADAYVRTFFERDLAGLSIDVSLAQMRRFWYMLAAANGSVWNASEFGRSLGLSYHTISRYADILEQAFLLRRLPPYFLNIGKRLVKSPKVYLTDTGLLHAFLGIETMRQLDVSPQRGRSWEGFIVEQIIRREKLAHPGIRFYFWRTATGQEIDLLVERPNELIGAEIKIGARVESSDWKALRSAMSDLGLARAYVVNQADAPYSPFAGVTVIPAARLLGGAKWTL